MVDDGNADNNVCADQDATFLSSHDRPDNSRPRVDAGEATEKVLTTELAELAESNWFYSADAGDSVVDGHRFPLLPARVELLFAIAAPWLARSP